ncbi:unnamed protein product [Trichogramma brassicae]|uniref:NF-X1-type domain-containing protein n=1 Tax=Trichogramma brassicae TaxID=86971 RepID=A0A6H5I066_9HYME|nr:unnamed protein product [Trichogramma brassicae]
MFSHVLAIFRNCKIETNHCYSEIGNKRVTPKCTCEPIATLAACTTRLAICTGIKNSYYLAFKSAKSFQCSNINAMQRRERDVGGFARYTSRLRSIVFVHLCVCAAAASTYATRTTELVHEFMWIQEIQEILEILEILKIREILEIPEIQEILEILEILKILETLEIQDISKILEIHGITETLGIQGIIGILETRGSIEILEIQEIIETLQIQGILGNPETLGIQQIPGNQEKELTDLEETRDLKDGKITIKVPLIGDKNLTQIIKYLYCNRKLRKLIMPCWRTSFTELYCECGKAVIYPPVPCGTRRPACKEPCSRTHDCDHQVLHPCNSDSVCPPCSVLTQKWCHGKHELRKAVPCHVKELSCGLPCGKPIPCNRHKCIQKCHSGPCSTECTQPCQEIRKMCGHICAAPCHEGDCPDTPCKVMVKCWLPSHSLVELVRRENGQRKVPGPMLNKLFASESNVPPHKKYHLLQSNYVTLCNFSWVTSTSTYGIMQDLKSENGFFLTIEF